ncbi:hypothetical protein CAPTEDRAFT_194947 [Capitella teleta]|uniref:THAP-type domain-containing protein n=1 Tax=Capitella teleta TaxID=283909 RepID=R7VGX3_CAPTE|nr:hypothetical protein CAPTEDRAFT_194947 [Capitella teleta]|eukprot:ELU17812.1 hypothetical protein CAPTEDRAFT_194947 [Capitella teleta]
MVKRCCAYGCRNSTSDKEKKVSFHMFPVDSERRKRWTDAVGRILADGSPWAPLANSVLCGNHFVQGRPSKDADNVDYIPTQFDFSVPVSKRGVKMHRGQLAQLRDGTLFDSIPGTAPRTPQASQPQASQPQMFPLPNPRNVAHDFTNGMIPDVGLHSIQLQNFALQNQFMNLGQLSGQPSAFPSLMTVQPPNIMNPMITLPNMSPLMNPIVIQPDAQQGTSQALFSAPWPAPIPQTAPVAPPASLLTTLHQPFAQPPPPPVTPDASSPAPSDASPSTSKKAELAKKIKAKYFKIKRLRIPGPRASVLPEYKEPIYELSVEGDEELHKIKLARSSQSISYNKSYRDPEIQNLFHASDRLEKRRSFLQAAFDVLDIPA